MMRRTWPIMMGVAAVAAASATLAVAAPRDRGEGSERASERAGLEGEAPATMQPARARLASAQVVTASNRPAVLRLAASGPIPFQVVTPEEGGAPADASHVTVRLYGIRPGPLATVGGLQPFSVAISAAGVDTLVTVGVGGVPDGARLQVRAGQRVHELEFTIVAAP